MSEKVPMRSVNSIVNRFINWTVNSTVSSTRSVHKNVNKMSISCQQDTSKTGSVNRIVSKSGSADKAFNKTANKIRSVNRVFNKTVEERTCVIRTCQRNRPIQSLQAKLRTIAMISAPIVAYKILPTGPVNKTRSVNEACQ